MNEYQDQELTSSIIGAAIEVHRNLGPGLLESVYGICLGFEFENRGISYRRELMVPVTYKNKKLDCGFRMDFLVEDKIILELKSVASLLPVHESQLLTYLRLMNKQTGLLINFNVPILKHGIKRCILNVREADNVPF